jgi:hypothetical protein
MKNETKEVSLLCVIFSDNFMTPLYEASNKGYMYCIEEISGWAAEFFSLYSHVTDWEQFLENPDNNPFKAVCWDDFVISWGVNKLDAVIKENGYVAQPLEIQMPGFFPLSEKMQWDDIEVHPVKDFNNGTAEVCEEGEENYWSVYVHNVEGGIICVADVPDKVQGYRLRKLIETLCESHKKG